MAGSYGQAATRRAELSRRKARERMRATGLDRTLLVFPTVADFRTWNGGSGTQTDGGGILTCG